MLMVDGLPGRESIAPIVSVLRLLRAWDLYCPEGHVTVRLRRTEGRSAMGRMSGGFSAPESVDRGQTVFDLLRVEFARLIGHPGPAMI